MLINVIINGILRANKGNVKQIEFNNNKVSFPRHNGLDDSSTGYRLRHSPQAQQHFQPGLTTIIITRSDPAICQTSYSKELTVLHADRTIWLNNSKEASILGTPYCRPIRPFYYKRPGTHIPIFIIGNLRSSVNH